MLNDLDYIGIGIGFAAGSVLLTGLSYGLLSKQFGAFRGDSIQGKAGGALLLASSLASGVAMAITGLATGSISPVALAAYFVGDILTGAVSYGLARATGHVAHICQYSSQASSHQH